MTPRAVPRGVPPVSGRIVFQDAVLEFCGRRRVRVRQRDGSTFDAVPNHREEDRARATALGYSTPTAMSRVHDALHLWIGQLLACGNGRPEYGLMRAVARGTVSERSEWLTTGEECLVMALARYLNTGTPDPWLAPLVLAGVDLPALRERAPAFLRGMGETGAEVP